MNLNIGAGKFKKENWINIDHYSNHYRRNSIDLDVDFFNFKDFDIDSNSIDNIYCSHVIEHLTDDIVYMIFNEAFRVLKKDGIFRVTCPDARSAYMAVKYNKVDFFRVYFEDANFNTQDCMKKYNLISPLKEFSIWQYLIYLLNPQRSIANNYNVNKITDIICKEKFDTLKYKEFLNYIIEEWDNNIRQQNPWQHINWWDAEKISGFLKHAGFKKIYESGYQKSFSLEMKDINYFDKSLPEISVYMECIK